MDRHPAESVNMEVNAMLFFIEHFRGDLDFLAPSPSVVAWVDPGGLGLLGVLVLSLTFLMHVTRKRIQASRSASAPSIREQYRAAGVDPAGSSRREIEEAILELDRVARQIHGQLDTRMARLEALIRAADERIERLSRMKSDPSSGNALDITVDEAVSSALESVSAALSVSDESGLPEAHREVHRLADEGLEAADIARRLDRPQGEIALILALRRTRKAVIATSS